VAFVSCEKKEEVDAEIEGAEITTVEYSLKETNCSWVFNYNSENADEIIPINSIEELAKVISGDISTIPAIDFTKQSLLLAYGSTAWGVSGITTKLFYSNKSYRMDIIVRLNDATVAQGWFIALISKKINAPVLVNVEQKKY